MWYVCIDTYVCINVCVRACVLPNLLCRDALPLHVLVTSQAGEMCVKIKEVLSYTGKIVRPKRMAVALLQPGQQLAKELHPVLDSLNKGLDSVMNLPIVKQLLGTMNWV